MFSSNIPFSVCSYRFEDPELQISRKFREKWIMQNFHLYIECNDTAITIAQTQIHNHV